MLKCSPSPLSPGGRKMRFPGNSVKAETYDWIMVPLAQLQHGICTLRPAKCCDPDPVIHLIVILPMWDMRRNFLHKFLEICMETPCWCTSRWAPTWRPEINRKIYDDQLVAFLATLTKIIQRFMFIFVHFHLLSLKKLCLQSSRQW